MHMVMDTRFLLVSVFFVSKILAIMFKTCYNMIKRRNEVNDYGRYIKKGRTPL